MRVWSDHRLHHEESFTDKWYYMTTDELQMGTPLFMVPADGTPIFLIRHLLVCHPDSRIACLGLLGTCFFCTDPDQSSILAMSPIMPAILNFVVVSSTC